MADRLVPPAFERDVLPRLPAGRRVDLGCAHGHILARLGDDAIGVDLHRNDLRRAHDETGRATVLADLNRTVPLRTACVDAIVCGHLLEHVTTPAHLVSECFRLLRPGGVLALAVPSPVTLSMLWTGDRYFDKHPGHLHAFSVKQLRALLIDAGFGRARVIPDPPAARKLAAMGAYRPVQWALRALPQVLLPRLAPAIWAVAARPV